MALPRHTLRATLKHLFTGGYAMSRVNAIENNVAAVTETVSSVYVPPQRQAKSWEHRAATSLARLWQQQGKKAEARDVLAPVYNSFTEGLTPKNCKRKKGC